MKRVFTIVLLLAAWPVLAQEVPLYVDMQQPIYNERGVMLTMEMQGHVQFLEVNDLMYPPATNGVPHPNNPVIATAFIGQGVDTNNLFSVSIPLPDGTIVARVFNADTIDAASFYSDSQAFTPDLGATFYPVFGVTTNPLDSADHDGDGLNNSWEKSLGSNSALVDSDGDGVSDLHEFLSGTGLDDDTSFLALTGLVPQPGGSLIVQWEAVSGKTYQLQGSHHDLLDPAIVFSNINGVVTSAGPVASTEVTNGLSTELNQFRIKLLE